MKFKDRIRQAMAGVGVALMTMSAMAGMARADETTEQQPVAVVVDFSGSMNEADADEQGTTRIAAAKSAVRNLLQEAPTESQLGLLAYGTNNDSCDDITTMNPVGSFDAEDLSAQVEALEAKGNTPIGPALRKAAEELAGIEGPRSIVLVSDGEPNCEPPPACDVAEELAKQGIDLTVHTIGFRIGGNAKAQETLKCIAERTGGQYTDVETADELSKTLEVETHRAMQGYQTSGERVSGGPTIDEPEAISAGQYVLSIPTGQLRNQAERMQGEAPNARWFSVPRPEGWDVAVSAVLVPPPPENGKRPPVGGYPTLSVEAHGDGEMVPGKPMSCYSTKMRDTDTMAGGITRTDLVVEMVLPAEERHPECLREDGSIPFVVERAASGWSDRDLDIEIAVSYIKADRDGLQFEGIPAPDLPVPDLGEATPLEGGTSFNDAPLLQPGQTIKDDVQASERRYFRVPVEYGQSLFVRTDFAAAPEGNHPVMVAAYGPLRQRTAFDEGQSDDVVAQGLNGIVKDEALSLAAPLKYVFDPGNMVGTHDVERAQGIAGEQYVMVGRSEGTTDDPIEFQLVAEVTGEPLESDVRIIQTKEELEAELGDSRGSTPVPTSSAPAETTPEPDEMTSAPESEGHGLQKPSEDSFPVVPALAGAGVLLVLAGGAWFVVRRRG